MTQQHTCDVVVIGGGHNGLAAAAVLARKGKSVCLIEAADTLGGMARNRQIAPGLRAPELAHLLYNFNPVVARDLGLGKALARGSVALPTVALDPEGRHVVIRGDDATFADGSPHPEAAAYALLTGRLRRFAVLLGQLATRAPPGFEGGLAGLAELARLGRLALGLKRLGKDEMREFLRVTLSNIHDVLLDDLSDGPLAGALAADAVRGAYAGPRSPGTVFSLMYRLGNGGSVRLPLGGMGAVSELLAQAATAAGCTIRTGSAVARVLVEGDRAVGVRLASGEELRCRAVLSSAGPMQTMQLAGVAHFDVEAARRLRHLRAKGTAARLTLVLRAAPQVAGLGAELQGARMLVAPSVSHVERAFNPVKYGDLPGAPCIEWLVPTLSDPSLSQGGQHVLSGIVTHVPPTGWTDDRRRRMTDTAIAAIAAHAPGLEALIEHAELLTPEDIEARTGAPGGHWHHAEMGLDQILTLRPANGMGHYRFGLAGLYLCGAGAHPGGDVTGAPGRNAALQVLKDGGS